MSTQTVDDGVTPWLLEGDVAVRFQTHSDLLDDERPDLERLVASDGDAATILAARGADGHWGRGFYQPKWTSSHYSLLELRDLGLAPGNAECAATVALIARQKGGDGGVNPSGEIKEADVCINGMFIAYASHFGATTADLESIVDFLLGQQLPDGGFNCRANRSGAHVSSVHTTTSVIDGLAEYLRRGYGYRDGEVSVAVGAAAEALLARRLFLRRSDLQPIRADFTRLHHPPRWHFDVLHGLDVLRRAGVSRDPRMDDALAVLQRRRRHDGRWAAAAQFPGATHVQYPPAGSPNRWVTLRALRVLRHFG